MVPSHQGLVAQHIPVVVEGVGVVLEVEEGEIMRLLGKLFVFLKAHTRVILVL
jgi:hypothetical protein